MVNEKELLGFAVAARNGSYSPYSGFSVGAALVTEDGSLFTGANVENASYGGTVCAERAAVIKAANEGKRKIKMIAISGGFGDKLQITAPCGICRQVLREFGDPEELKVITGTGGDDMKIRTLKELLPESFGPDFREN